MDQLRHEDVQTDVLRGYIQIRRTQAHQQCKLSIEAMMLSCALDSKENEYLVLSDIHGALLNPNMEGNIHVLLEGIIVEMIYRIHIWYNRRGKPVLYVQLKKTLYGTLQAALLFWKLLKTLQDWGFKLNLYDKFVANES